MTLNEFVTELNDGLTEDCQIPLKLPQKSYIRTIRWAKKWFKKNYEFAVEETYVFIKTEQFETEQFQKDRLICLDESIVQVHNVQRVGGLGLTGDFSIERMMANDMYVHNNQMDSKSLEYYVAKQVHHDWVDSLLVHPISYDYNYLTHKLNIIGETPSYNIVLTVDRVIPDEMLFEEEIFYRYCLAQCKIKLSRIIGTIKMPLIGNAEIDYDTLKADGDEELEKVKTEIKENEGVDYIFTQ